LCCFFLATIWFWIAASNYDVRTTKDAVFDAFPDFAFVLFISETTVCLGCFKKQIGAKLWRSVLG
jgi:hypothetical protein